MQIVGKTLVVVLFVGLTGCVGDSIPSQRSGVSKQAKGLAVAKTYHLSSAKARAVMGSSEIPVRARSWTLESQSLDQLDVTPVDASALPAALANFAAVMRPTLAVQAKAAAVDRSSVFQLSLGSLRGWAHKPSGFLSLIDTERASTSPRRIMTGPEAVEAILEQLGTAEIFGLQGGQTLDVIAVKEIRGSMVDAKSYERVMVRSPGEIEPAKSHTVSYRVIFGRRQGGVPIQQSAFAATITPQGRLVEISRFWRAVTSNGKKLVLASMPAGIDAWVRQGLTARSVASSATFERLGCGYLDGPMRAVPTSLQVVCRVAVKDPGSRHARLMSLPLAGQ